MSSNCRKLLSPAAADAAVISNQTTAPAGAPPPPPPHVEPMSNPSPPPFDSSMALTVLVLITALFFMGFFSVYIRRFSDDDSVDRHQRRRDNGNNSTDATAEKEPQRLQALPSTACGGEEGDCAVCLGELEARSTVKRMPACNHVFHSQCIDAWLSSHPSCPLCRTILHSGGGGDGGSA